MSYADHLEKTGQTAGLKGQPNDDLYDVAHEIAHRLYAMTRGGERGELPFYLQMAWPELDEAQRALYVEMAKAGIEHERNR